MTTVFAFLWTVLAAALPLFALVLFTPILTDKRSQAITIGFVATYSVMLLVSITVVVLLVSNASGIGLVLYPAVAIQTGLSLLFIRIVTALLNGTYDPQWYADAYLRLAHRFSGSLLTYEQYIGNDDANAAPGFLPVPARIHVVPTQAIRGRHAA